TRHVLLSRARTARELGHDALQRLPGAARRHARREATLAFRTRGPMTTPAPRRPYLTIIVPGHQGERVLPKALAALEASTLPRDEWELIVVDDASTDATPLIAAAHADTVVRLAGKPHGPAYARNRGFEVSRGEVIV